MTARVTIGAHSQSVPPLHLTPDDARKLGALLIAEADRYEFKAPHNLAPVKRRNT